MAAAATYCGAAPAHTGADYRIAKPASDEGAARFLLQAQFSATRAEIGRVRSLGAELVPDIGNFGAAAGRPDYPIDLGFMR